MKKIFALLLAAVMTMSLLAGCGQKDEDNNTSSGDNTAGDSQYHIGFVVHTTSGDVMAAIEYGAKAAAEDYGVKLTYTGPADSDNTQQISMFESLVAAGCDAIVIIAGDSTVWDEPIAAAVEKGKSAFVGPELYRKTLGVIGLGAIGALVCNIGLDLGMDVYGYDPFLSVDAALRLDRHVHGVKDVSELYRVSDYVTIHVPYNSSTKDFINAEDVREVFRTHTSVHSRKVIYPDRNLVTLQNIAYIDDGNFVIATIIDVTREEKQAKQEYAKKKATIDLAQNVIYKQMMVAQNIAGLLGETTAETKTTLMKLCSLIDDESESEVR